MRHLVLALLVVVAVKADFRLARDGQATRPIVIDAAASTPVRNAAKHLAATLEEITGARFAVTSERDGSAAIFVGPSGAAQARFTGVKAAELKPEEIVVCATGDSLLLMGGGDRGTFYAVNHFLQKDCGVRWWTPWASRIPKNPELAVSEQNFRHRSPFEMREPFWMPAFDAEWSVRNYSNGQSSRIPQELGGRIQYKGFVHTFYPLVPPEEHFAAHPEWYSLIKGKRTHERAQLCLTNPKLREFAVARVKEWLREAPEASILSVSQNDWYGACECEDCRALDEAEGSHAGTMLAFVNFIAEKIEPEFPQVAIDTLAYQYTRKPPKTLRPRKNVIVRLCSIECNFREPLDHPSNAAFARDIEGWSKIADRLYIWDYTTDFAHYVQPHPNWFTLGPNVRFFANHKVRGLFEQGAYQSHGSEMAELRAWVLAQLLWNPEQDDRILMREFLDGYYGAAAAPKIYEYLELMHKASEGHNLTCYSRTDAPFLNVKTLAASEQLWEAAEKAVKDQPEFLERVRLARLPLRYVWLSRWDSLRKEAERAGMKWPLPDSRQEVAEQWRAVASGRPDAPWTKITRLNEPGLTPDEFLKRAGLTPGEKTEGEFRPLFPKDGVPEGWVVRAWDDVKNPPPEGAMWKVIEGVLHGSEPRGTWLVSEKEYADFTLKFEFKLGERGNSGCGLRFPGQGDPAFDGLELQMVDPRYYPPEMQVPPNELTGSLYRAIAPTKQLFKPTAWNRYEVTCKGPRVTVMLNGEKVVDTDLTEHDQVIKRHNGQDAVPLKDRPRKGHIGFQELSRAGGHVEIRNAMIKELAQ